MEQYRENNLLLKTIISKSMNRSLIFTCLLIFFSFSSFSQSGWFQLPSPTTNILYSVHFEDTLTGWSVGQNGTIIKTTNGGNSWFIHSTTEAWRCGGGASHFRWQAPRTSWSRPLPAIRRLAMSLRWRCASQNRRGSISSF